MPDRCRPSVGSRWTAGKAGRLPRKSAMTRVVYRVERSIVLVGMMGAGKTAVGRQMASRLGLPFVDSDGEIETSSGMTISEIFSRLGEPDFREMETATLSKFLSGDPLVMSVGGGAFIRKVNRRLIRQHGTSVWLKPSLETVWERVRNNRKRPLIQVEDPRAELSRLLRERNPVYAKADIRVHTSNDRTVSAMAKAVITMLVRMDGSGLSVVPAAESRQDSDHSGRDRTG